ncbi:MAG: ExbD/TolR family protein [Oxalobacter sp.]
MKNSFGEKGGLTEINMVPLIDVMLVLVVILLMTATFVVPNAVSEGIHVSLPQAQGAKTVAEVPVQIELDAQGRLSVDGRSVTVAELSAVLVDMPRERSVLIAADKAVQLQAFVTVMDTLRQQGFTRISVRTQR